MLGLLPRGSNAARSSSIGRAWTTPRTTLSSRSSRVAAEKYSRKNIDDVTEWVKHDFGCKGMAWFKVEAGGTLASPIAKNFKPEELAEIAARFKAEPGDFIVFIADKFEVTCNPSNFTAVSEALSAAKITAESAQITALMSGLHARLGTLPALSHDPRA